MCFDVSSKCPKPKIAKRDITIYKVMDNNIGGCLYKLKDNQIKLIKSGRAFFSNFTFAFQKLNVLIRSQLIVDIYTNPTVSIGLHSYRKLERAKNTIIYTHIVKGIIPKGSKYMYNDNEYVSNRIILKKIVYKKNKEFIRCH